MRLLVALLGSVDYAKALALQERLLALRQQGEIEDIMLLLEHPPTLTLGVRGDVAHILVDQGTLEAQGVKICRVNRGGDITYHGPGQIVGYPILDLNAHGRDVKEYVRKIEGTFISLLQDEYGITAGRDAKYPGVWVGMEKITAIGCAVKRWVTMHGFAFNVNTNLEHFRWINPCGITDRGVTSLQKLLGRPQDMERVCRQVVHHFSGQFGFQPEIISTEQLNNLIREKEMKDCADKQDSWVQVEF